MKYLLDTNICIHIIRKKPEVLLARIRHLHVSDLGISVITLSELEVGVEKSTAAERNRIALIEFISPLTVYSFDAAGAREYGRLRAVMEKEGKTIGSFDMLIAAHALALHFTLVTNNLKEFKKVPGLCVETWV